MNDIYSNFKLYARSEQNIPSTTLDDYANKGVTNLTPHIIEERQMNIQAIDVFSRLMKDRVIFLGTGIDDQVANIVMAQLLFLENAAPNKDINIYINSPGGSVYAGLGIYDVMQYVKPKVATVCAGMAASMGAVLLTAGEKGMRAVLPHSRVMIHQPLGGAQGQASDIEIQAKQIIKLKQELYEILALHSGQQIEKIEQDSDRDYWMKGGEVVEYGLVDEVIQRDIETTKNNMNKK